MPISRWRCRCAVRSMPTIRSARVERTERPANPRGHRETPSKEGAFMSSPIDTVSNLTRAMNRGDVEAALALYEADAAMVVKPGQIARGPAQLRAAIAQFVALKPNLESRL